MNLANTLPLRATCHPSTTVTQTPPTSASSPCTLSQAPASPPRTLRHHTGRLLTTRHQRSLTPSRRPPPPHRHAPRAAAAVMSSPATAPIAQTLWDARVPLHITHESAPTTPFIAAVPRFSYLALLLPRLSAFFGAPCSSFHFEDVQLRNLAAGLLVDLYRPALPWRLTVADGVGWDIADTFLNCVKEVRASHPGSFFSQPLPGGGGGGGGSGRSGWEGVH